MGNPGNVDLKLFYALFRQADSAKLIRLHLTIIKHTLAESKDVKYNNVKR
jgi:hypothetical protein